MNKEDFRNKLLAAASPAQVLDLFKQEEASYFEA